MFGKSLEEIYWIIADRINAGGIPARIFEFIYRGIPGVISEGGTSINYLPL